MKKNLLFSFALALSLAASLAQSDKSSDAKAESPKDDAGKKFKTAEAATLVGKNAKLVGKVSGVKQTDTITHINFDKPFPNQTFTAVLFAKNAGSFTNLDKLVGKTVQISGKVEDYNGKPQVVILSTNQLTVLSSKPEAKPEKTETPKAEK
ncbi:MAG: hypothetical protein EXS35_07975 [Pedosphaera sp.]|nr:hypothetical protein [Pedosphaera sp.]